MSTTPSFLARLPELVLEALMVVFAVMVALAVEGWSDDRQMQEFADRARQGVLTEVRANLDEFRENGPGLLDTEATLLKVIQEEDMSLLEGFNLGLPDFSSAAWRASQVSPAASYFDFDWVIEVSRAYETYELYARVEERLIDELSRPFDRGLDRVTAIYGRLAILTSLHGQVQERLEVLLEEDEAEESEAGEDEAGESTNQP